MSDEIKLKGNEIEPIILNHSVFILKFDFKILELVCINFEI